MSESPEAKLPFPHLPHLVSHRPRARRRYWRQRLRRLASRNPQWWMIVLSAGAWVFLLTAPHAAGGGGGGGVLRSLGRDSLAAAAMVVAMMLPLTLGRVSDLARSGPWRRRHRAVAAFLAGHLAVWTLVMLAINTAWRLTDSQTRWMAAAAGTAVLWEFVWRKFPQPKPRGAATARESWTGVGCARLGAAAAGGCVASCWALMVVCAAFAHSPAVMPALFCVQLVGRHRPAASPAITALAVAGVCAASLALGMGGHNHAM